MSKYIQSFYNYPVTFACIGKTIPSKDAEGELRNIAQITDEEYTKLQNSEPYFRSLVNKKKYRVLEKLPESYKAAAVQVNEALAEAAKAKEELAKAQAELAALKGASKPIGFDTSNTENDVAKMSYKQLQEKAKELGLEKVTNVSKEDLISYIKSKV